MSIIHPTFDNIGLGGIERKNSEGGPTSLQRPKGPSRAWLLFGGFTVFLSWLEYVRTWTCNEERVAAIDVQASNATKRTVLAIVFNAIYQGLCHTMAETAEQISISKHVPCDKAKPSDEVAMHRICGWALKSVMDQYKHKVDCTAQQLSSVCMLKLPNDDKHLLPLPAQYLDRGGLTFLRQELWPWMLATEKKMIVHLNQASYRQFGSKLFEVQYF